VTGCLVAGTKVRGGAVARASEDKEVESESSILGVMMVEIMRGKDQKSLWKGPSTAWTMSLSNVTANPPCALET
jgi:hypothetical protein